MKIIVVTEAETMPVQKRFIEAQCITLLTAVQLQYYYLIKHTFTIHILLVQLLLLLNSLCD